MVIGVKMTNDGLAKMISLRKTWCQLDGVGIVSEEVDFRGDEMCSEKNDF